MKKRLLLAFAAIATFMNMSAWNVDDYVYTNSARFKIVGANLVTNGNFADSFNGWTPINAEFPAATTFNVNFGTGPNGSNTIQVNEGQTALESGIYQSVAIPAAGTYVVTMQVMNMGTAGFTDLDLSGGNTNYINAYYQKDETTVLAYTDGTNNVNLQYGTDAVCAGYAFAYSGEQFTDVAFSFDAPADGNLIIDLRGLAQGLEIANIEVHAAQQAFDRRVAEARVAWVNTILNGFEWTEDYEYWEDVVTDVDILNQAIASGSDDDVAQSLENLEVDVETFLGTNCTNVLDYVATKDGSAPTGNNSANWMNWSAKWNKLQSDYKNQAPWAWSTDRWCHKTAATNSPMSVQWMRGTAGPYDNIATLTTDLEKGVYFWGAAGEGGMMTLNKQRWARSMAVECAETQFFFNGDTTEVVMLSPVVRKEMLYTYKIAENVPAATLGIRCNIGAGHTAIDGFDVNFYSPVLYKINEKGQLTVEEKAYLEAVQKQLDAFKGRIDVAKGYMENEKTPWGKEQLQIGITEAEKRYADFSAMTQSEILETLYDMSASYTGANPDSTYTDNTSSAYPNIIMNAGVRYINNLYIDVFTALNKPLTDMPAAIAAAQEVLGMRIYSGGDKATFEAAIKAAQDLYDASLVAAYSEEAAQALVDMKAALEAAVETFKNSISKEVILDIDFGTQGAPAEVVTVEDPTGEKDTYYTIEGAKGTMILPSYAAGVSNTSFDLGYNATDSLGMLRVGNGVAYAEFSGAPIKSSDIVEVEFDYYIGNLINKKCGFNILDNAGEVVCGLNFSKYSGNDDLNTFGIDYNGKIAGVGSSSASNAAISAASNKTHFDVVIDFGAGTMYCTTSGSKGTATTEPVAIPEGATLAKFQVMSDYNNADRRSWFDNLKISNIAADIAEGIKNVNASAVVAPVKSVKDGMVVIKTAKGTFNAAGVQVK